MLILSILLSIWLCRLSEKPGWFKVSHIISMLALEDEHPARSKGCAEIRACITGAIP